MQRRNGFRIVFASAAVVIGVAATAAGVDVAIPGSVAVVKSAKLAKLVSKSETGFALPVPGSTEDPTLHGATLTFFDTQFGAAGSASFVLDPSGWTGLGNPAGQKGYRYKGKDDATVGACSAVLLKSSVIKAVCKGAEVTLTPPFGSTEGVILGLPAGTTSLRYCAELGGAEKKNDATAMKRIDAPAPTTCPALPSSLDANDLIALADDALQGRNNNTAGSTAARQLLIDTLSQFAAGLDDSQTGDAAFQQPFVQSGQIGTNVLAVIPGSQIPGEYVMIGAHYDHLGSTCRVVDAGDTVCNGATDNAAGVAVALAVARGIAALPTPPRRSVIVALWDAEEDGLLGSQYYAAHPVVPLASTVAYVNLDIQGANLLPSLKRFTFAVGAETGAGLGALVDQATGTADLDYRRLSYIFGQGRSDYVNLVSHGVPTVFFSDSTGPCYHTNADEVSVVDFAKLETQARAAYDLTVSLADAVTPPAFVAPSSALATYADAIVIDEVLTAGLADLALFGPTDQTQLMQIQAEVHTLVTDGQANFDSSDVLTLLFDTVDVINLLTNTACDGFL